MTGRLIPGLDPAPLPGPPWLFHLLWLVTFLVHLMLVNVVLGGSLLALITRRRETSRFLVEVNSWTISFAITFGVAPLLFVQVILGRFFYTATVLLAPWWLGLLWLLTIAYYLNYIAKHRLRTGRGARPLLAAQALCFLAIAAIQVAVNLLHMQPQRWESAADRAASALLDPTFVPRYLHTVLAAAAVSGLLIARVAAGRPGSAGAAETARFGVRAAVVAAALQIATGFWLLFAIPREILLSFLRAGASTLVPLGAGIVAGVLMLLFLVLVREPLSEKRFVRRAVELTAVSILFMAITRHQLRALYLAPARSSEAAAVSPQWGMILLFLVTLLAAVGLAAYSLARAAKDRAREGEPAA